MALQRPLEVDGIMYPAAYTRITTVRCDKDSAYIYATTHADLAARLRDDYPIFAEEHMTSLASLLPNFFASCYVFLKTQPGFEEAIDVDPDEALN